MADRRKRKSMRRVREREKGALVLATLDSREKPPLQDTHASHNGLTPNLHGKGKMGCVKSSAAGLALPGVFFCYIACKLKAARIGTAFVICLALDDLRGTPWLLQSTAIRDPRAFSMLVYATPAGAGCGTPAALQS